MMMIQKSSQDALLHIGPQVLDLGNNRTEDAGPRSSEHGGRV